VEGNDYRKRFRSMQKIGTASTRGGAVMAQALAGVASKPSLAWMLLSQNQDIVSRYLNEGSTRDGQVSISSRRRGRSSSSDAVGFHGFWYN
jgi:hypothetical protein